MRITKIKLGLLLTAAAAVGVVAISSAATTISVTSTGSPKAGTAKAPVPFTGKFDYIADNGPNRQARPDSYEWWWEGVLVGGKGFPVCTKAMIDAAQSDAPCPKGSLIGKVTEIGARVGPSNDETQFIDCKGKDVLWYNGGPNTIVWFIVGPGEQCAGLQYFPPYESQLRKVGNSTHLYTPLPNNIKEPLPGVEGALTRLPSEYFNRSVKVKAKKGKKAKKSYYLRSVGCKGTREFTIVIVDKEGTKTATTSAGKCSAAAKKK